MGDDGRMRHAAAMLLVGSLAAQVGGTLTPNQMAADLRQLAAEAATKWAYAEDRREHAGVDLDRLAAASIARLPEVHDDAAFVALVREFVAALQDGHAWVQWSGNESRPFHRWPFTVADTADGIVVDKVLPTWNGTPVDLRRGDLLVAIDGEKIADVIATVERRTFASTAGSRRRWAVRDAAYGETDPRRYTVQRADGAETIVSAAAAKARPVADAEGAVEFRQLAEGVAGIRITTFAHHDAAAWAKAVPSEREELLAKETEQSARPSHRRWAARRWSSTSAATAAAPTCSAWRSRRACCRRALPTTVSRAGVGSVAGRRGACIVRRWLASRSASRASCWC
jgi:hypothetical protein